MSAEEDGISSVPRLFFDPAFDLSRPDMFPVICPSAAEPPPPGRSARTAQPPPPGRAALPPDRTAGTPRLYSADKHLQEKVQH